MEEERDGVEWAWVGVVVIGTRPLFSGVATGTADDGGVGIPVVTDDE